jgi:hypothetical protein
MPRVPLSDLVAAIQGTEKPLTESEIADRAGVSRPTVSDRREKLQDHPDVGYGQVGGVHAFWDESDTAGLADNIDDHAREMGEMLEQQDGQAGDEFVRDTKPATEPENVDNMDSDTATKLKRLAHRRMVVFSAIFLSLGAVFFSLTANMVVTGAVLPGAIVFALGLFCVGFGTVLIGATVIAQIALERPLKALLTTPSNRRSRRAT